MADGELRAPAASRTSRPTAADVSTLAFGASDASVAPPGSMRGDVRLLSFEATGDGEVRAIAACFVTHLGHGFAAEEVGPIVLDTLRDLGARKLDLHDLQSGAVTAVGGRIRREDLGRSGRASSDASAVVVSELDFTPEADLVACVSACNDARICGVAARAPRFRGELGPPPPPDLLLSTVVACVHHPEHAVAVALTVAIVVSAMLVTWRRRPPLLRRPLHRG